MAEDNQETPVADTVLSDGIIDVDFAEEVVPLPYAITSYGADFLVDGLVSRLNNGDIVVPSFDPEFSGSKEVYAFQRGFVWKRPQQDRFIESLLLGLPVPGVFLVREENNIMLVLDGQQRLRTLQAFCRAPDDLPFQLEFVQEPWVGMTYASLDDEDRRRLDNSIIHATIMRQDQGSGEQQAVYTIFERLNTGGTPLQPQEIRVALYGGEFIRLIRNLNNHPSWRRLYGNRSPRLKDHELILRFFAFYERAAEYERPLKGFLNTYLAENRFRDGKEGETLEVAFRKTTDLLYKAIGRNVFRPVRSLNAAVVDSIMVGVARRLEDGDVTDKEGLSQAYSRLVNADAYIQATTSSTAAEETVESRLDLAYKAFKRVK